MTAPLTDRAALTRNRRRAARAPALFLHQAAADEVQDRLSLVNKTFHAPAVVTGWPEFWAERLPGAHIVPDEDVLNLTPGAHDLVIHAMSMHWAGDLVGQIIQARRALVPDGLFLAVLPGGDTLSELRAALAQAESDLFGGLSARVLPMAEIRDLGALLQRANLALPVADSVPLRVRYRDMHHLMHDLRAMGEGNAMTHRPRHVARRALFDHAARIYAREFGDGPDHVRATFDLIVLTGWAPDESQPKPLRPGSAKARLADALRVQEKPLKD